MLGRHTDCRKNAAKVWNEKSEVETDSSKTLQC